MQAGPILIRLAARGPVQVGQGLAVLDARYDRSSIEYTEMIACADTQVEYLYEYLSRLQAASPA